MPNCIALLRGINVGGARKILMSDLRGVCEGLGYLEITTYIQSGNVVLQTDDEAADVEAGLERAIAGRFGFAVAVVVRTAAQWSGYQAQPFGALAETDPARVMLALAKATPAADAVTLLRARATADERVEAVGDAIWLYYANGTGRSKLSPGVIDRYIGSPATTRNWRTVEKLAALAGLGA
jgi:uncharacterized protein (DUF1697 family)